jgi:hypothetical protein
MAQCRANREEEEMVLRARLDHLSDEDGQEMMNAGVESDRVI